MDRYIGLDAHSASCTVAVVGPSGRRLQSQVLETNGKTQGWGGLGSGVFTIHIASFLSRRLIASPNAD